MTGLPTTREDWVEQADEDYRFARDAFIKAAFDMDEAATPAYANARATIALAAFASAEYALKRAEQVVFSPGAYMKRSSETS